MANVPRELAPISLQGWPTCKDCLAWSQDDLAVAVGEFVHILTLRPTAEKSATATHPNWQVATVRINAFTHEEWPEQRLASIHHFSIGEEQSISTVVALAWSPEGLGIHRRSVLAILTSNLVLSIWETDGATGNWSRTCVINQHVAIDVDPSTIGCDRRRQRIRSFTWCYPWKASASSGWGVFSLLTADDDNTISVIELRKDSQNDFGTWTVEVAAQHTLPRAIAASASTKSSIRRVLKDMTPIRNIYQEICRDEKDVNEAGLVQKSLVTIHWQSHSQTILLQASKEPDGESLSFVFVNNENAAEILTIDLDSQYADHNKNMDIFKDALHTTCSEFDQANGLDGHFRVRFWGTACLPNGLFKAACVTLHPVDMMEYYMPSAERCTVVFQRAENADAILSTSVRDDADVQKRILSLISRLRNPCSELDRNILQACKSLVYYSFRDDHDLMLWSSATTGQDQSADVPDATEQAGSAAFVCIQNEEQCDLCHTSFEFVADHPLAKCRSGHVFTRCNLCFIAIQEPGISKYCSRCGKQFLDLSKPESSDGPSLSRALFAEFDVCPYCQGKYRG